MKKWVQNLVVTQKMCIFASSIQLTKLVRGQEQGDAP